MSGVTEDVHEIEGSQHATSTPPGDLVQRRRQGSSLGEGAPTPRSSIPRRTVMTVHTGGAR